MNTNTLLTTTLFVLLPALVALYLDVTTTLGVPSSTSFIEKDSLDVLEQLILVSESP